MRKCVFSIVSAAVAFAIAGPANAGFYKTITPDGDASDWSDIPFATTTSGSSGTPIDFSSLKIANDDTNVYFLITYATAVNPQSGSGVFTAIDSDNSAATGLNVFGSSAIGANLGFQNDSPFTQSSGNFNTGGTVANTYYHASPYNAETLQQEIAIPLTTTQADASTGGYTGVVFAPSFTVEFYTTEEAGTDTLGPVQYTLASTPEPAMLGLIGLGAFAMIRRRNRA